MWPQLIYLALVFAGLGMEIAKHGELIERDGWSGCFASFIILIILWWGGFFDCFIS